MAIKVGVSLTALNDLATASAVRDLIAALAEFVSGAPHTSLPALHLPAVIDVSEYSAAAFEDMEAREPVEAPTPAEAAPEPVAVAAPELVAVAAPEPEAVAAPKPAAVVEAAPEPAAEAAPEPARAGDSLADRYHAFVRNLPPRSQQFLQLVEERGTVTINEVMRALGLLQPKAMGGITGSIGRWAPAKKVPLPYEMTERDGERAWRWIGIPGVTRGPHIAPPKPRSAPNPSGTFTAPSTRPRKQRPLRSLYRSSA